MRCGGSTGADRGAGSPTLASLIEEQARLRGDATFVVSPESGRTLSFGELHAQATAIAALLAARGIVPGDAVSFMLPNSIAAISVLLAAMAGGFIASPLNLVAQDSQLAYVLAHSETRLVFVSAELAPRLQRSMADAGLAVDTLVVDLDHAVVGADPGHDVARLAPERTALLMYTSGTTGTPKGVLLSHANLLHAGATVASAQALSSRDRVLSSLPLYHINGQCIAAISTLVAGGSIVLPQRFSASQWWRWVETYRPTWLNFVPTIVAYLLQLPDLLPSQREACKEVRFARSASAPLPREHQEAFERRFGIGVIEAMGLTESASIAFANPLAADERKSGSAGKPLGVEARVIDAEGRVLADGQAGEVQLRGPSVMRGYYKAPEATAEALSADGWLSTGDLGYRDADGFFFITGRLKELIIKGGENIAPREIDEALLRHPAVLDAAAVGIPDAHYGQDILACVILKPEHSCSVDELHAHSRRELGPFKAPRIIRLVDELPRGPSGKVQRLKLAELA